MSKTYIFAGASSAIAVATAKLLQLKGHKVIGISTKTEVLNYNQFYQVENYGFDKFPAIDDAIDGLVYFAGTINLKPFHRITAAEFKNDYDINALGAVAFTQAYLTHIKKAPTASIVFISSVAASVGLPFHSSIAMAKASIEGLTKALAAELAPNIRVNCVAPSLVNTPLGNKFINTPEKLEAMQKRNPLHKVGQADDVAAIIAFLLSSDSGWITAQTIAVDGGMNLIKNN